MNPDTDGKDKDKAQAALDAAQDAIDQADAATDFSSIAKALAPASKDALKGQSIANKAGGSGGGGTNNTFSATVVIGGTNDNFVGISPVGEWDQSSGLLDLHGARPGYQLSAIICSNFPGTVGTYNLGDSCGGFNDFTDINNIQFYGATSGMLVIQTFDAATHSTSGTFSYEASDGITTITVTNGIFNINNLTINP